MLTSDITFFLEVSFTRGSTVPILCCFCRSSSSSLEVCTISNECFAVPSGYHRLSEGRHALADEEEELMQLAIQQSLMQQQQLGEGSTTSDGTLGPRRGEELRLDTVGGREEITLAEALRDSAILAAGTGNDTGTPHSSPLPSSHHHQPPLGGTVADVSPLDPELELALELSRQQVNQQVAIESHTSHITHKCSVCVCVMGYIAVA